MKRMTVERLRRILAQYDNQDVVGLACSGAHSGSRVLEPTDATYIPELDMVIIHTGPYKA